MTDPTPPELVLDRRWMRDDFLDIYSDSTKVTSEVLRHRGKAGNLRFTAKQEANLVSSMVAPDRHRPILDLDFPHMYVPSTTPGHGHLYINNVVLNDMQHYVLINTLVQLGILGKGSQAQLDAHGLSLTRPPHIKKKDDYGNDLRFDEQGLRIYDD